MTDKITDPFDLSAGVPPIEGDLRPKPKLADGISKRIIAVALGIVAVLMVIVMLAIDNIDNKPVKKEEKKTAKKPVASEIVNRAPVDLFDEPTTTPGKPLPKPTAGTTAAPDAATKTVANKDIKQKEGDVPAVTGAIPANNSGGGGGVAQLTPEQQAEHRAQQERLAQLKQARTNGLSAKPFPGETGAKAGGIPDALKTALEQAGKQQQQNNIGGIDQKRSVDGEQDEKLSFVKDAAKEGTGYHPYAPVVALSKNEVKAGAFIPMTLQQGINSDLPGEVTARVTEGVYDTIEGCRLLIPPLTTVKGKYDSKIAIGQSRMLIVWNNMIFPDGQELNLAGMLSYDTAGMTGLESDVDNHYLRLFGVGLGMSLISATAQIAVPSTESNGDNTTPNYSQTVSSALAQQFGQLGGQLMGKYAAVQPTLQNYIGEKFEIMVPRTIVFSKVWRNRCIQGR